jgi:hypothetical protein
MTQDQLIQQWYTFRKGACLPGAHIFVLNMIIIRWHKLRNEKEKIEVDSSLKIV